MPDATLPAAFAVALLLSLPLCLLLARWAPRLGLLDRPGPRKSHATPTPRAGGVAVYLAVLAATPLLPAALPAALLGLPVFLVGLADDLRPLPAPPRLLVHLAAAAAAAWLLLPGPTPVRVAAVVWVGGMVNACNFIDNMDLQLGGVTLLSGAGLVALGGVTLLPLLGAVAGFLWLNRPPARLFMGDAGSTFVGFVLGVVSAQAALRDGAPAWAPLAVLCLCAVPWYDLVTAVVVRVAGGRSPFEGGLHHLSHRLVARGLRPGPAVAVIHLLTLASGAGGLLVYWSASWAGACLAAAPVALGFAGLAVFELRTRPASTVPEPKDLSPLSPASGERGRG
jgi:UDP-GlcNAc:undecaprenyl-phosphate GlcNAc-1-phosphate transferase